MLAARSPIAIYRALICLKETTSQDQEARTINAFQTFSQRRESYDKTPQCRNYYHLTISFSPDNTKCNFCQDKMRKGLGKRFHQFARLPYTVLRRKSFLANASNDRPISTGKDLCSKLDVWLHGKIQFTTIEWLNAMSQSAKRPKFFLTHLI